MRRLTAAASSVLVVLAFLVAPTPAIAASIGIAANVGDSFAVGEGGIEIGGYTPGSDTPTNQCHRSYTSPGRLSAAARLLRVNDVGCSGATTQNVLVGGQYGEPSQVSRIAPTTKYVFVMVGGNDAGFGALLGCFLQTDCDQTPVPALSMELIRQLGPRLAATYVAIQQAAPQAEIVVELYPPLLPPVSPTPDLTRCPEINPGELEVGNQIQVALRQVIREQARAHGFRVADAARAFAGHSVCDRQPYFYRPGKVPLAATYHPNLRGRGAMAVAAL